MNVSAIDCSPTNCKRMNILLDTCVPVDPAQYIKEDGILYRKSVPYFNKAGFYSGFTDAILKVWDGSSIERVCELLVIVGWIPTATTFQKILTGWKKMDCLHQVIGRWRTSNNPSTYTEGCPMDLDIGVNHG